MWVAYPNILDESYYSATLIIQIAGEMEKNLN